ncbi:MAG: FHA domain-containing protein [Coleofasciculus sp. G1-WW12-02]|uniref:FHA domain-containing protein n=1 Tax=Coleofasciculus sp. G1-WW12-02 TaxID=3068483 RepID=UPI0032FADC94
MEIEQRLGLYQVFLKLYEYHRGLLDEILQLEKTGHKTFSSRTIRFVTGIIQSQRPCLMTNLVEGKTQTLFQPQGIWTIGRDRQLAISIPDPHLSRHHAAIYYLQNKGFYLVDFKSTNGTYVNGEPVHGHIPLKDGDCIRLSTLAFYFFICNDTQKLDSASPEIIAKLKASKVSSSAEPSPSSKRKATDEDFELPAKVKGNEGDYQKGTSQFLQELAQLEELSGESALPKLNSHQRSEILDRFFSRQIPNP